MRLAPKLATLKSQCAFDFRGADVQRIRASTHEFPVPDTLPNPDLVAALPRLRRYARVLTGDVHRADDLVQDTLARAWDKRHLWRAGSDLRACCAPCADSTSPVRAAQAWTGSRCPMPSRQC